MTDEEIIAGAGYKVVSWPEFEAASDVPSFIRVLANRIHRQHGGGHVVYDPAGGRDGWLLVEDDRAIIIRETAEYLRDDGAPQSQQSLF